MKALLVIDVQKALVEQGDFSNQLDKIVELIESYQRDHKPVVFMKHVDEDEESEFYRYGDEVELDERLLHYDVPVLEKETPSSFYQTDLDDLLKQQDVDQVTITGFNTEFCCLFTAIAAFDRGYEVTLMEEATATVNDEDTYNMKGLDIKNFIGTVLSWSGTAEVKK
ncbi:isochorismatase family protein [Halobacillus litoralis]|uniref:isochorismatase family protein n=1 Tax=Halobacillus litoralis TaxID=45668 RepID=UPI001CD3282F|nr:isochorismatase family protein [Halobacillus litoralis]MCA0971981.1 isochorismatase family protein [Halobacillus litoralis]